MQPHITHHTPHTHRDRLSRLVREHPNGVVDINEKGNTLKKAANDANHGVMTLMFL